MAHSLPTNVTADNWRRVRQEWQNRVAELGLDGIADSFWEIGHAARKGFSVDDEFCAEATSRQITATLTAARTLGVTL